ncbi:tetratricopeptide repeat protein [Nostoc sp.]|uniref:tetratricopeptide repeat protein n=1 Tax=Nostoc sp. TaxID=1180 RepID=UPI002FFD2B80
MRGGFSDEFGDRYSSARTYHNLGMVAQELREYDQAGDYYQQALEIYIEFGDRYSSASTYGQLGLLAQMQENYAEGLICRQRWRYYVEYQDEYMATVTRENLEGLPE